MLIPSIETTDDGTQTLRHPLFGDSYHSLRGAVGEAEYVFIGNGLCHGLSADPPTPLRILEVGLGSGLNCLLTARYATQNRVAVEYHALELYPVPEQVWQQLEYAKDPLFGAIHRAEWGVLQEVAPGVTLKKIEADLAGIGFDTTFDLVYMDAFAPDTQPEMWSPAIFEKLYAATAPAGVLVTYCAKGDVKRALRAAGYELQRLRGALGKRHMLRAIKPK